MRTLKCKKWLLPICPSLLILFLEMDVSIVLHHRTCQIYANKELTIFTLWRLFDVRGFYWRKSELSIQSKHNKNTDSSVVAFVSHRSLLSLLSMWSEESLKMISQNMSPQVLHCLSISIRIKVEVFTMSYKTLHSMVPLSSTPTSLPFAHLVPCLLASLFFLEHVTYSPPQGHCTGSV